MIADALAPNRDQAIGNHQAYTTVIMVSNDAIHNVLQLSNKLRSTELGRSGGRKVDILLVSLSRAGSSSHDNNTLWPQTISKYSLSPFSS